MAHRSSIPFAGGKWQYDARGEVSPKRHPGSYAWTPGKWVVKKKTVRIPWHHYLGHLVHVFLSLTDFTFFFAVSLILNLTRGGWCVFFWVLDGISAPENWKMTTHCKKHDVYQRGGYWLRPKNCNSRFVSLNIYMFLIPSHVLSSFVIICPLKIAIWWKILSFQGRPLQPLIPRQPRCHRLLGWRFASLVCG